LKQLKAVLQDEHFLNNEIALSDIFLAIRKSNIHIISEVMKWRVMYAILFSVLLGVTLVFPSICVE
jgi:hypothetical protein